MGVYDEEYFQIGGVEPLIVSHKPTPQHYINTYVFIINIYCWLLFFVISHYGRNIDSGSDFSDII